MVLEVGSEGFRNVRDSIRSAAEPKSSPGESEGPSRVRCVARWLAEPPADGTMLGGPVACPYSEMVVRDVSSAQRWPREPGRELVVELAPDLFEPGSVFSLGVWFPGTMVRWPSGTWFSAAEGCCGFSESGPALFELLDAVSTYATGTLGISRDHTPVGAWVSLSVRTPGEPGGSRKLISVQADKIRVEEAVEQLCAEARLRFGDVTINAAPTWSTSPVRYQTTWIEAVEEPPTLAEGDTVAIPWRPLVVRHAGATFSPDTTSWWVSTAGEYATRPATSGPPTVELGEGLVAPGGTFVIDAYASVGGFKDLARMEIAPNASGTIEDALDLVPEWAANVAHAVTEDETWPSTVRGAISLLARDPGEEIGRCLTKAATGSARGIDAILDMLEAFCEATVGTYS